MKKATFSLAAILFAVMMVFCMSNQALAGGSSDSGPGNTLLFTYYDIRSLADGGLGLTDNYFTVINTSTHWVQSHVRVRTGDCSVEVLDFDVLQSPKDVFVFDLYEDGGITFASCDTNTLVDSNFTLNFDADGDGTDDCFLLDSNTFPEMVSLITECGQCDADGGSISTAEAQQLVKKGYVEVIEEGQVIPQTSNKNRCISDTDDDSPTIPNSTLRDLIDDGDCQNDILAPDAELMGRQYYVTVDVAASPVAVTRLAQLNAVVVDSFRGLVCAMIGELIVGSPADFCNLEGPFDAAIIHENTYSDELAANGSWPLSNCTGDDYGPGQEDCYAYAEAETIDTSGATATGANDMNWCFYEDTIGSDLVINKFGAAATFGPTLADVTSDRNGHLSRTAINLTVGTIAMSLSENPTTFISIVPFLKQYVDSHYFYAPQPGPYDLQTAFAFLFPFKHFIGESETITAVAVYDNSENQETIQIGKFISPGLPTPGTFADEAELFKLTPPYNEGWIRFELEASNATAGCVDETPDPIVGPIFPDCEVWGVSGDLFDLLLVGPTTSDYMPGFTGAVFTSGSQNIGASPFNYNSDRFLLEDIADLFLVP